MKTLNPFAENIQGETGWLSVKVAVMMDWFMK